MSALRSRKNRRAKGKCRYCSRDALPRKSVCQVHLEKERERKQASREPAATQACTICDKPGHNRRRHRKPFGGAR